MNQYEYLILTENPDAYFPDDIESSPYRAIVQTGEHDGKAIINITHTENPTLPGDTLVLGGDPHTGVLTEPFDSVLWQAIRPYGNNPDGTATGYLGYHTWAGVPHRLLGDPEATDQKVREYPLDIELPLEIEIRHKLFNNPAAPAADGWGFHAEIIGFAGSRDPSVRSIGAYDDPEYTQILWPTTGGFIQGVSDWQVDEEGNPLQVWYIDSWDGLRLAEPRDWYIALLWASVEEGRATLPAGSNGIRYQFWDRIQGGGGSDWVDTGVTVLAQYGTVYKLSANASTILSPGQTMKFTEAGQETTFTGNQPGYADRILIDPFVQAAVGDVVWVLE